MITFLFPLAKKEVRRTMATTTPISYHAKFVDPVMKVNIKPFLQI